MGELARHPRPFIRKCSPLRTPWAILRVRAWSGWVEWAFPGRQTGHDWSPQGVLCVLECVGESKCRSRWKSRERMGWDVLTPRLLGGQQNQAWRSAAVATALPGASPVSRELHGAGARVLEWEKPGCPAWWRPLLPGLWGVRLTQQPCQANSSPPGHLPRRHSQNHSARAPPPKARPGVGDPAQTTGRPEAGPTSAWTGEWTARGLGTKPAALQELRVQGRDAGLVGGLVPWCPSPTSARVQDCSNMSTRLHYTSSGPAVTPGSSELSRIRPRRWPLPVPWAFPLKMHVYLPLVLFL